MTNRFICGLLLSIACVSAEAAIVVEMQSLNASPSKIGTITLEDTQYGLLITPALKSLTPGLHGFHLHETPSCADNGNGAGGHFDPNATHAHNGPYVASGHLGDLPALFVDTDGNASVPIVAPRLSVKKLMDHSLIIHAGQDNYSDSPQKLGGGGARIACGVITHPHK